MPPIPRDTSLESTLALQADPYRFISKRCRRYGADLFQARIMLQNTICMMGKDAAELIYDDERFERHGAAPLRIQKTLLGVGGVQAIDGAAHRHRKQMFMRLMTPERITRLADLTDEGWRVFARMWSAMDHIVLFNQSCELLCRAVCLWAGVPLAESEVLRRTDELTAMFNHAGDFGPKHWRARFARTSGERWIGGLVEDIQTGRLTVPEDSPAYVIALHQGLDGQPLDSRTAAVELINLLRPTVAIAVYFTLAATALHEHPACRLPIQASDEYAEYFVQEVRRFYPFFPYVTARVRHDFEWRGYLFPAGTRVLLDIHGTNRDPRQWESPDEFRPERFRGWDQSPFSFIPQGGGDHYLGHRCAGERITIELMKRAVRFLAGRLTYDVPGQDLRIDHTRLPALPRSRFVMSGVRINT